MDGYAPWLPAGILIASRFLEEKKNVAGSPGVRIQTAHSDGAAGLAALLQQEKSHCGSFPGSPLGESLLRRRVALELKRTKSGLDSPASNEAQPAIGLPPAKEFSSAALKACQLAAEEAQESGNREDVEDEGEAGSDADSIASDEWAEALWSPGMCLRPLPTFLSASSDESDSNRSLSMLKEGADEWPADASGKPNFSQAPGQRRSLVG